MVYVFIIKKIKMEYLFFQKKVMCILFNATKLRGSMVKGRLVIFHD